MTTQEFRKKLELNFENFKKKKGKTGIKLTKSYKCPPITNLELQKKFVEIKENINFSKSANQIFRTITFKTENNCDIKTQRISIKSKNMINLPLWSNTLLRNESKITNLKNKNPFGQNVILTENLNLQSQFSQCLQTENYDNFFISKMGCNFTSK